MTAVVIKSFILSLSLETLHLTEKHQEKKIVYRRENLWLLFVYHVALLSLARCLRTSLN